MISLNESKQDLISKIIEKINSNLPNEIASIISKFVVRFYSTVSVDDLEEHTLPDLYGAVLSFWNFIYERKQDEIKIRIYNPEFEKHGWQSRHTIIEIIQKDIPFLLDSILMAINQFGITAHLIIQSGDIKFKRNHNNQIVDVLDFSEQPSGENISEEAPILIEIDKQTDESILTKLTNKILNVSHEVMAVVTDWKEMRKKVLDSISGLENVKSILNKEEIEEAIEFLKWIEDHHITFLAIQDYALVEEKGEKILKEIPGTGLGLAKISSDKKSKKNLSEMTVRARELTLSNQPIIISKTNTISTVHRATYTDYIGIKQFDKEGNVIGERCIIGLFTSSAYSTNPKSIPLLRKKVAEILKRSGLKPNSHAEKILKNIIDTFPRDDLFQANVDELLEIAQGIYFIQERRKIKLFVRRDVYGRFVSCLVFVPKERFNTEFRKKIQQILLENYQGKDVEYVTYFSDSVLARIHFVIRIPKNLNVKNSIKEVEKQLIEVGRSWEDEFTINLTDYFGEELGNLYSNRFKNAFPAGYREFCSTRSAVYDVLYMSKLNEEHPLELNLYKLVDDITDTFRFKIFHLGHSIHLSDVIPILENMGLKVINETPFSIKTSDDKLIWINDFGLIKNKIDSEDSVNLDLVKELFQEGFRKVWYGKAENDKFNSLILNANLNWREISVLRAYAKYLQQVGFNISQLYIEETINSNPEIVKNLIKLFHMRFQPNSSTTQEQVEELNKDILKSLDAVANLNEDKVLRRYHELILATLRTNYYQLTIDKKNKDYLSFKFDSRKIPELPLPHPMYEIFVYSPRFEGIHLRSSKVARGGIRWSDRKEDFRTEILGLMKAQVVKNAIIVPSGAKGGYVAKCLPVDGSREEIFKEGLSCYQNLIRGLLDLTDNKVNGQIITPKSVVRYDDDDPYLVVAADKGTATFSDIANEISNEYNFWLGDAFASGGSSGYDHKKIGITARGAWESIKRHFRELNVNIQKTPFTVVGIGDMSGDVFGNGMLLSKAIKLIGAFNHLHIFIDPNPDPEISFNERARLFKLPRSSWSDYDKNLISAGGGVYKRTDKSITLSIEAQKSLGTTKQMITPNELIKIMLQSPVDLLWNGGIGTFVKSSSEINQAVGDRSNDAIRINAIELRCKVVGEGGNLGFTQLARMEFASTGGLINADFIDNSGGVDCSDHEVNIKILLNDVIQKGDMTLKQRNELLVEMTEEIAQLVLSNNYKQTQAISVAAFRASQNIELHKRYINALEKAKKLDRSLESLPDDEAIQARKQNGQGLNRPTIAILLAYTKSLLSEEILSSDVPDDSYFNAVLKQEFPKPICEKLQKYMLSHSLKREIISTLLSNNVVNEMGFAFIYRMHDETGATTPTIVRAYSAAKEMFNIKELWNKIDALDEISTAEVQNTLLIQLIRLLRRTTRWLIRNRRKHFEIQPIINHFSDGIEKAIQLIPNSLIGSDLTEYQENYKQYLSLGLTEMWAEYFATSHALYAALDIVDVSIEHKLPLENVTKMYFMLGEYLGINWLRAEIIKQKVDNHWEALSREALRDDLDWQQKRLVTSILKFNLEESNLSALLSSWSDHYTTLIKRWMHMLAELKASNSVNFIIWFAAIRELLDLTQTSSQVSNNYSSQVEETKERKAG